MRSEYMFNQISLFWQQKDKVSSQIDFRKIINHSGSFLYEDEILIKVFGNGRDKIIKAIIKNSINYGIFKLVNDNLTWKRGNSKNETFEEFKKRYEKELPIIIYAKIKPEVLGLIRMLNINNIVKNKFNSTLSSQIVELVHHMYPCTKYRKYGIHILVENTNCMHSYLPKIKNIIDINI